MLKSVTHRPYIILFYFYDQTCFEHFLCIYYGIFGMLFKTKIYQKQKEDFMYRLLSQKQYWKSPRKS